MKTPVAILSIGYSKTSNIPDIPPLTTKGIQGFNK